MRNRSEMGPDFLPGGMSIKASKLYITAGILSILFCVAVFFFLQAYNRYDVNHEKKEALTVRFKVLTQQKREAERKVRILSKLNDFVHRARSLGLEQSGWDVYEVYINEPVTFLEMEQLLNQCTNSPAYYFKPVSFHAKTVGGAKSEITAGAEKKDMAEKRTAPIVSAGPQGAQTGDILLTLKGAFVVRR